MKNWQSALCAATLTTLTFASAAQAQTAITQQNRLTGALLLQDTGYESDNDTGDLEGQFLVGGYKAAITPKLGLGGGVGLMFDGEFGDEQMVGGGSGFRLFLDGQYEFYKSGQNKFLGTAALNYDKFNFDENNSDIDVDLTELKIGGLFVHDVRDFELYAGLEAVLYSDGEYSSGNFSADLERDDRLNLRLGAAFNATNSVAVRGDLLLIGEQTIQIGADFSI